MDAVILAAGRNERLTSIMPPYRKPMIEVDGVPLVRTAVELALSVGVRIPVVVAAPINALDVDSALSGLPAHIVLQRKPLGPADALRVGLTVSEGVSSYRVMVLLSDNILTHRDVLAVSEHKMAVGVVVKPRSEAGRFTWFDPDKDDWREKVTIPDGAPVQCWVGPFVGLRSRMTQVVGKICAAAHEACTEALIGPYLTQLAGLPGEKTTHVHVSSVDVGTPEAYAELREDGVSDQRFAERI